MVTSYPMHGCSVPGCERDHNAKGFCRRHYDRWKATGDPGPAEIQRQIRGSVSERIAARVKIVPGPLDTPCHEWQGPRNPKGYGRFSIRPGHAIGVPRWVLSQKLGRAVPRTHVPDHLCRNPPCVNPEHLEEVTHRENQHRSPGLAAATRERCPSGHEYTPENTITERTKAGYEARRCRICRRKYRTELQRRRRARHRSTQDGLYVVTEPHPASTSAVGW